MAKQTIEEIVKAATDLTKNKDESRQEWLARLATACQGIKETAWDDMGEAAQEWVNDVVGAIEENKPIPEPPDHKAAKAEKDEDDKPAAKKAAVPAKKKDPPTPAKKAAAVPAKKKEADKPPTKKVPAKAAAPAKKKDPPAPTKKVPAKKEADKPPTKKVPAKAAAPAKKKDSDEAPKRKRGGINRGGGAQAMIKNLIIDDPTVEVRTIIDELAKHGYTPTTVSVSTIRSGMLQTLRLLDEKGKLKSLKLPS